MGIFDKIILPPSEPIHRLLKELIIFTSLLHLIFVLIVLGSLFLSLYYYKKNRGVSQKLAHLVGESAASLIVFGFLPFVTLIFLYGQYFYSSPLKAVHFLEILFIPATIGFVLFYFYKRSTNFALGLFAFIILLITYYFFLRDFDLMTYPEAWPFTKSLLPHIFSIQTFIHFLLFLLFGFLLTGSSVLFIYFTFTERKLSGQEEYYHFLKNRVLGWVIGSAVILPVFILWDAYTAQVWTINSTGLYFSALGIFFLMILFFMITSMIKKAQVQHGLAVFILAILAFSSLGLKLHFDQITATREYFAMVASEVHKKRAAVVAEREALYAKMMKPDITLGKQIFNTKCSSCHAFDRKVFGPPYNEVLKKYVGKEEELRKFISNPVKKNPGYPPMPAQGLTPKELLSVASYLLSEYEKNSKKGE